MSSSSTSPKWKHDVFVSFREDGVIKNFISDLFKRLNQVGINYFEGDKREGAAQETFAFALLVFSENYVRSSPRLNKLDKILRCEKDPKPVVIPIFYTDRAKVLEIASDDARTRVEEISGYYELKAANSSSERNLIDKIVGRLVKEIHSLYSGKVFIFGPFGSKGRNGWNSVDIKGIDRKGIAVEYGKFIESVTFEVDEHTPTVPQTDGKSTFKVKLECGEYITSFAGSKNANNGGIINSLTFRTNKRILGPIGREEEEEEEKKDKKDETDKKDKKQKKKEEEEEERQKKQAEEERKKKQEEEQRKKEEEYFSVPSDAGEVIEFFWKEKDNFLESVGARVLLRSKEFYPFQSVVGLFGMKVGQEWHDKPTRANVREIIVYLDQKQKEEVHLSGGQFIRSIEFMYKDKNGISGERKRHGSNTGGAVHTITIDCPDEYLTSISGYYTNAGITSLAFRTNKRMAILIGEEKGIYFSSPTTAGKIVGFYGYIDGQYLRGIGAYFEPISIGPFGGGCPWDHGKFYGVREIHPFVDTNYIHGIKFLYDNGSVDGYPITCGDCTKGVSRENQRVLLDYPREYLTSISGYMQNDGSISSLTFYSNKRRFLNGKEGGTYFWYPSTGNRIIGFYGTWGKTLNYIGMYVEPIPHLYPFKTVGRPIKGSGGTPWDDGVHTNVRGFRVTVSGPKERRIIESITFRYDDNGSLVEGSRHGGGDASSGEWEMLDFPKERLIRIEGNYMRVAGDALDLKKKEKEDGDAGQTIIHDLRIVTTKGKGIPVLYAPRGSHSSTRFVIPKESKDGRIVGFFGMAGTHLNSIGARLEPY